MQMSAEGYRQMNTPAGAAMALLMGAAAKDAAIREQREHELTVADASRNVLVVNGQLPQHVSLPPNVVLENGVCKPAAGFGWVTQDAGDMRVRWCPGKPHPTAPHVVAGPEPIVWNPAQGYGWVSEAKDDLRVVPSKPFRAQVCNYLKDLE